MGCYDCDDDDYDGCGAYYSAQCRGCRWGEYEGGCLNKAVANIDVLGLAKKGECPLCQEGEPQKPPVRAPTHVDMPIETYRTMLAENDRHRAEVAAARAEGRAEGLAEAEAAVRARSIALRSQVVTRARAGCAIGAILLKANECDAVADLIAGLPR